MFNVGIIGVGNIGYFCEHDNLRAKPASHFGAYKACPETEVVAVADVDEKTRAGFSQENPKVHMYSDYEDMLNKEQLDIVSVCTPVQTHHAIVRNAVRFSPVKLVFCEKPLSLRISECQSMIESAKNFGVALAVDFTRRWDATYNQVKAVIDSKQLGELVQIVGYASREKDFAGNIHMADLFNWFAGDKIPPRVYDLSNPDDEKVYLAFIGTPPAGYAPIYTYVDCHPTSYLIFELDVIFSSGRISISDNGRTVKTYSSGKSSYYQGINELSWIGKYGNYTKNETTPILNAIHNIVGFLNGKETLKCSGEDGQKALELHKIINQMELEQIP